VKKRLVLVEDRETTREMLAETMRRRGWEVVAGGSVAEGRRLLEERAADLLLTDLQLPDGSGLALLSHGIARDARLPVIVMSAFGTIEIAVEAMKGGAYDFVTKPFDTNHLVSLITRAAERRPRAQDSGEAPPAADRGGLAGESAAIRATIAAARKVAPSDATVLVLGESGTGKELVARAIHSWSGRSAGPMLAVNCAAIPGELMESEFFGAERGSYTGATSRKLGKVELASGGTLFLDELAELPAALQAKLLRVLQERTYMRVGGTEELHTDIRVIAATNRNLAELVERGEFREDLYYRVAVFPIRVPALRERPEDIAGLAGELARRAGATLTDEAVAVLEQRAWPGNVRELQNAVERAAILAGGEPIGPQHLDGDEALRGEAALPVGASLKDVGRRALRIAEERAIRGALSESRGNKAEAARRLGISYKTLWAKLKEYEMG
jgi:two-component system response regulator FlrC